MPRTPRALLVLLVCTAAWNAAAVSSLEESLGIAQGRLESGEFDKALELLRELQVDYPDSAVVSYGIGKALYGRAMHQEALGAKEEAVASLTEAEAAFARVTADADMRMVAESAFGRLNASARKALLIPAEEQFQEAVGALRGAVAGYEQFLREHPGHMGVRQNLDHVRLKLKELLQNPPAQQKQEDQEKQPPQDQKQPVVYFLSAGTEIPRAQAKAEGNQLQLVVPDGGEKTP